MTSNTTEMPDRVTMTAEIFMAALTIGSTLLASTDVIAEFAISTAVYFVSRFLYRTYGDFVYNRIQEIKKKLKRKK